MRNILLVSAFIICLGFQHIPMTYHIPITDVNSERYYVWLSWFMDHMVDSNDTVNFEIASHGGSVFHGYRLVSAIIETEAHTVAKVKSGALSMGAVIMVVCDDIQASKYSEIMFHKARIKGRFGTIVLDMPMIDNLVKDYAYKYLTDEEIKAYEDKQDVWIKGLIFAERVKKLKRR